MEGLHNTLALVGAVVVITWVWRVVNWAWLTPKRLERCLREQGLCGNPYKPLLGDLKESYLMTKEAKSRPINLTDDIMPRVLPFVHKTIHTYGKNSFIWIGQTPRVNIMDPELIKEILNKYDDYRKPGSNPLTKLFIAGLANYDGDKWAKHRKIINPAFHQEKLKKMVPAYSLCAREMVSNWDKMVSAKGSVELDVWPCLETLTADVISRTAFGSNYEEGKRVFHLQKEQAALIVKLVQSSVYIPGLRFLPTKTNNRIKEIEKEVQALLRGIIHKREMAVKLGETGNDDLLGVLMESNYKEIQEHKNEKVNVGLTIEEVVDECKLFYFAGQETTSVLLVWTMVLLSIHPNWQTRAREEVFQVFGKDKPPGYDALNHLKVVTMILYEVLRLYPPAIAIVRRLHKNMILGEMSLPKGVQLAVFTMLVHRDPDMWGDAADEFKPERFSEGVSKATKNQTSFIPFGWGPRICIGQNFALLEAKMALSVILQHFSFELSPSYAHAPFSMITTQPQYGAHLILHKI